MLLSVSRPECSTVSLWHAIVSRVFLWVLYRSPGALGGLHTPVSCSNKKLVVVVIIEKSPG